MLFKCPENVNSVSIEFQQFDADENGVIDAPDRFRDRLLALGFTPGVGSAAPLKSEDPAVVELTEEELQDLEKETEELKAMNFGQLGEYLVGKGVDIKNLNSAEKRLNVALDMLGKKVV